jgi:hypothetical protein
MNVRSFKGGFKQMCIKIQGLAALVHQFEGLGASDVQYLFKK